MKKAGIILGILFLFAGINVQAQKLAHVDTQSILNDMPEKDSIETKLKQLKRELDKEVEDMQRLYQKRLNEYLAERDSLSKSMQQIKEDEIRQLEARIYEMQDANQERLATRQNMEIQKLVEKIKAAIDKVAKAKGVTYVIDASYLLATVNGTDLTADVRKELGLPAASTTPKTTPGTVPGNK